MIPRLKPTIGIKELVAALRPARRDDVERFEQDFATLMEQKYALAFPYGRTGMMLLFQRALSSRASRASRGAYRP